MNWLQIVLTAIAAWFALSLAAVGAWNVAQAVVRRRSFAAHMAAIERERQGWT